MQAGCSINEKRLAECKTFSNIGWTATVEDTAEFCGLVFSEGTVGLNVYRKLLQIVAYKAREYADFEVFQQGIKDYLVLLARVGEGKCAALMCMLQGNSYENVPFAEAELCIRLVKGFAEMKEAEFHKITQEFEIEVESHSTFTRNRTETGTYEFYVKPTRARS